LITTSLYICVALPLIPLLAILPHNVMVDEDKAEGCEGLIGEVLGHLGSSEGWTATLHDVGRQYPCLRTTIRTIIPHYYGTMMAPLDLTSAPSLDKGVIVGSKLLVLPSLPFTTTQLSDHHGVFERYESLEELIRSSGRSSSSSGGGGSSSSSSSSSSNGEELRHFSETFMVVRPGPFHGLGLYVVYGDDEYGGGEGNRKEESGMLAHCPQHACCDLPNASTNWYNVFLPISKGEVVC